MLMSKKFLFVIIPGVFFIMLLASYVFVTPSVITAPVIRIYPYQAQTLLNSSGYVVAQRKASLSSKATGRLEWLGVVEGSRVKKGDLIALIESDDLKAKLLFDESKVVLAKAEVDEAKRFFERAKNHKSVGVTNPLVNFNFDYIPTGAFQRLRMNVPIDQATTSSIDGTLRLTDFSQNNKHFTAAGFEPSGSIIKPVDISYGILSPYFDEAVTDNKVRVRSLISEELRKIHDVPLKAPLHSLPREDDPQDNEKFSIDFTIVGNQDLEKCISDEQHTKCIEKIESICNMGNVRYTDDLHTIADYRREFNTKYCDETDVLVWGESDAILPNMAAIPEAVAIPSSVPSAAQTFSIKSEELGLAYLE